MAEWMSFVEQRSRELFDLFEKGGMLMYPLLFFSILALWIFLERSYHLRRAAGRVGEMLETVREFVLMHDQQQAYRTACQYPGPVAAVFRTLLQQPVGSRESLEEITTMQARQELQRLTGRLPLLSLIANLAPLLGLLGTVLGMVKAFQQVASAQGAVRPNLLAGGIWEALLTTVVGLLVAIPAFLFHYALEQRVKRHALAIDHSGMRPRSPCIS
jgi:biopolymer transport protein ExbB